MKVLVTAKQRGSANVLNPVVEELERRGHTADVYATGNPTEAAGFGRLAQEAVQSYQEQKEKYGTAAACVASGNVLYRYSPELREEHYARIVKEHEMVLVGMSGMHTPDFQFMEAAKEAGRPVVAVQDQNNNYQARLGTDPANLPTLLAVMSEDCIETMKKEFGGEMGKEAAKRSRVIGWTAFDGYAEMREDFTESDRIELLTNVGIDPKNRVYVHFTQTMHPNCAYMAGVDKSFEEKIKGFLYEQGVTQFTFEAASDLGLKLAVKPHPGEEFDRNYTKELADRHGFTFIPAKACNTQQLMLAAYSVTAGRSTCLTEATLLDRNTGGIIPDMGEEGVNPFPPMALGAIPYTQEWEGIKGILKQVTTRSEVISDKLMMDRKKFSVDGKASKRLVDLIEEL